MEEFFRTWWYNFRTRRNWFLGTIAVVAILWLLIWRAVDGEGFIAFFSGLAYGLLVLSVMILGLYIMYRAVFPKKKKGGGH